MKFKQKILAGLVGVGLMAGAVSTMAAPQTNFTPAQKSEIQNIVKDYLIQNPEVLVEVSKALQAKQQDAMLKQANSAIAQNANVLFNADSSPYSGNAKGDVTIVEFFDYQCVHCKKMAPVINSLLSNNANVRIIYKDFPIFGKSSVFAAEAVLAAQLQGKYHALHDALLKKEQRLSQAVILKTADEVGINTAKLKKDMKSEAVQKALMENRALAEKLRLMGTPAFIVGSTPNGKFRVGSEPFFVPGAASEETLTDLVQKAAMGK